MCRIQSLLLLPTAALCFTSPLVQPGKRGLKQQQRKLRYTTNTEHSYQQVLISSIAKPQPIPAAVQSTPAKVIAAPRAINNRHSASDWLYNLRSLPDSTVLRDIRNPVISLTVWAAFISLLHKAFLWTGKAGWADSMCIPHAAHSFLVSSLGLLLVFRTNSAYQRFLEGRKIWEDILTVSRNLSRMATLYRDEMGSGRLQRIKNILASFPYLLRHHIRSGCLCNKQPGNIHDDYKLVLNEPSTRRVVDSRYEGDAPYKGIQVMDATRQCFVDRRDMPWCLLDDRKRDTLQRVAQATNRPLWVCDRLGQEIVGIPYGPNFTSRERLTLLVSIDKLTNAIGQCERIHQTAVPLNYARHALRSLTLWLLTLPFCMVKDLGLLTGPVTGVVAWLLFGVYQIGHSIEDPFQGSLRLSILCDGIRRDVLGTGPSVAARDSAFELEEEGAEEPPHFYLPEESFHTHNAVMSVVPLKDGSWSMAER